jgi:nicotinamidase-related amidase
VTPDQTRSISQYVEPLTADNAAFLFIDNQTSLMLGVQSMDTTVLLSNTTAVAALAKIYDIPAVLTTTHGGIDSPAGFLLPGITEHLPDVAVIDRLEYLNAMSDVRFADAVRQTGRRKVVLSGITTDFCLVYPAASLIAEGYHVYFVTDASGSWTRQIDDTAILRLVQMGATPINTQALMGELSNSDSVKDLAGAAARQPALWDWLARYTPAPAILGMNASARTTAA